MAMTPLERKQNQLKREEAERKKLEDATYPYLQTPFFEYLYDDANWSSVEMNFDLMGLPPPQFDDDSGPASHSDQIDPESYRGYAGSIGRAEVMVDQLLDAAAELASIINKYKVEEIDARIAELERADLADQASRSAALADVVRLTRLRERLSKRTRRTLEEWSIKGE